MIHRHCAFAFTILAFLVLTGSQLQSQTVIFSEDFGPVGDPEHNGATTGSSAEGYTWNTNCPSCVPTGDFFETLNGQLRGNDTNGPAFFTSGGIDATGCLLLTFQFDYNAAFGYAGNGNLECAGECPPAGGDPCSGDIADATSGECGTCWDFLAWEISSGSVSDAEVVLGLDCNAGASGSVESDPLCVDQAGADPSNVNLTITMSMWATNEWMEIDNITILCYTETEANNNGIPIPPGCGGGTCTITIDDVIVTDPSCDNVSDGELEIDVTATNLSGSLEYSIDNGMNFQPGNIFSNLGVGTYDIIVQDDADPSCFATTSVTITAPAAPVASTPPPLIICFSLVPPAGEILNLDEIIDAITNFDLSLTVNWYFDMAGMNPIDPTDPADILTLIATMPTTIYATVTDGTGCESNIVSVSLDLNGYPPTSNGSLTECRGSSGDADFTLTDADGQFDGGDPSLTITYHNSPGDAQDGIAPITGTYSTPSNTTLFVRIENAAGCASTGQLNLIVNSGITAEDAMIDACDDGSGQATFDLTSVESTVLNGQAGTVTFYEDMAASSEIFTPSSYTSGSTTVYAVIANAMGCLSEPSEITLNVISIDPADVFLSFDPASGCGNTVVSMTLNIPGDPANEYIFNVSFGPVSTGPVSTGDFNGFDGDTPFMIGVNEDYIFVLNSVTGPGPLFCQLTFSPGEEYIIPINSAPDAFPASITACANALGEGTFDLTSIESTINGNTGFAVDFYEDIGLSSLISPASAYVSGEGTIFAVVDAGDGCVSDPVPITLLLEEAPAPVDFSLDITSSCTATDVTLTFSLPNGDAYNFDLLITNTTGTTVSFYAGITNFSTLTFNVTETTTFSITEIESSFGCIFTLAPGPSETITIGGNTVTPAPAALSACDNGAGEAVFDLTEADATVNGGSGETVLWFEDLAGNIPIGTPAAYPSSSGTVFAAINAGGCISETAAVTLTVLDQPEVNITLDQPISCPGDADATITAQVVGASPFNFDWNLDMYDGQQTIMSLGPGFYALTITDDNGCENFADITISDPPALVLDCRANTAGQGSGLNSYTFTYSDGTPFYILDLSGPINITFTENIPGSWDTAVLPPGAYTFTLTDDNGCSESCSFVIDPLCDLSLMLDGTDPNCAGEVNGTLTLDITSSQTITLIDWNDDNIDGQTNPTGLMASVYTVTVVDELGCVEMAAFTLNDPPVYDINCAATTLPSGPGTSDGVLTVTVNSGPGGPYTVTYDNGNGTSGTITEGVPANTFPQSNLPPGTYQIVVTNGNMCSTICTVDLEVPACPLTLGENSTPPTCMDGMNGTATVTPQDGTGPYNYDWSDDSFDGMDTASGLAAGQNISVTVTDMVGCVGTVNFMMPTPTGTVMVDCSMTTNPTNAGTSDGQADLVISGGTVPYTISWAGPASGTGLLAFAGNFLISNLPVGNYTITVEDGNGCTTDCTFMLTAATCDLTLDLQGTNPTCAGTATGSLDLSIDSSFPITSIDWNEDTFDGTEDHLSVSAGLFAVTVTDAEGCVASTSLTLVDPPALFVNCSQTTAPSTNISTDGAVDVVIAGGTPGYTINWAGPVNGSQMEGTPGTYNIGGLSVGSYTITIEDSNGCLETCTFVLIEVGACTFDIMVNTIDESCPGAADGSAFGVPMGGTAPYTYSWSTMEDTPAILNLSVQDYGVTVVDANDCIAISPFTINTANPAPTLVAGVGVSICADSCYNLPLTLSGQAPYTVDYTLESSGMMTNLQAIFNADQDSLLICPESDGIAIGDFSITFTQVVDANCQAVVDQTVDLIYLPPTVNYFAATICQEDSLAIGGEFFHLANPNGTVILPGAASSGCDSTINVVLDFFPESSFDFNDIICLNDTLTIGGTPFHAGNPSGSVVLDNASANGCDSTINVNLSFYPESSFFLNNTICQNDTIRVGNEDFYFDNPNGTVVLENTSENGCDSTVVVNLFFHAPSTENITGELCPSDTLVIAGQAFYSGFLSDTIVIPNVDPNGCDSTLFVNLSEILPGTTNITADLCAGDTLQIAGVDFTEDFLQDTILLSNQAANGCDSLVIVDLNLINLSPTPLSSILCPGDTLIVGDSLLTTAGTYDILLEDAATSGCDSLIQVDLSFFPEAESTITGVFCPDETITIGDETFNITNSSGTVLLPNASLNGCDSTVVVDLTFSPSTPSNLDSLLCFGETLTLGGQTFSATNPGGIVVLPNAASSGCDSTIFVNTTYRPELFASLGPDTTLCGNATTDGVLDLSPGANYDFSIQSSSGFLLMVDDVNEGQYTFGLGNITEDLTLTLTEITSTEGCSVTVLEDEATIRYSDSQLNLVSIGGGAGSTDLSCADATDGSVQANISGGIGPFTYEWSTGDDGAIIDNLAPGTYSLTVTDEPGCRVEASINLTAPGPLAAAISGESVGCFGATTGSLSIGVISGGVPPYEYSLDNEFFLPLDPGGALITNLASGAYTVYIQDANDCQISVGAAIPEGQELLLELGDDETIQFGDSILLDPQFDFTPASWTWTPTMALSQPDTFITYAAPLETTIYQLEMTDINGCSASDIIRIFVERDLDVYIPTAFSPDGDGSNDLFMIFAGQGVEEVESFQIYDRWGNQVFFNGPFQPNDPLYGWDGTHNGEVMNAAVFVYFAEVRLINGETVMLEGEVMLMR